MQWDDKRFEREIEKPYQLGYLTGSANEMLEILNTTIGKTFRLDLGKELNKHIKQTCLDIMVQEWKQSYYAKKSITAYFTDLCKHTYSGMYKRLKREMTNSQNQQTT